MKEILPYNEYLLIQPNGRCRGFTDYEGAKAFINIYYEKYIDRVIDEADDYHDVTDIGGGDASESICRKAGAEIGTFSVYKINDLIDKIESDLIFEDEKKEIIDQIVKKDINFNINSYNIDLLLTDIEKVNMMETYGKNNLT